MIQPTFDMKDFFLDRPEVAKQMDKATRIAMMKSLGAFRKKLRATYRKGKRASKPGNPPRVHTSSRFATLKNVLFAYDARTKSGVAGSIKLPKSKEATPGLLEGGGTITRKARRRQDGTIGKPIKITIAPRPAVGVALNKSISEGKILTPWANTFK